MAERGRRDRGDAARRAAGAQRAGEAEGPRSTGSRTWPTTSSSRPGMRRSSTTRRPAPRRRSRSSSSPTRSCSSTATTTNCSTTSWRSSTSGCSGPAGTTSGSDPRYTRAARQVHALFIDVNELTDRTENTLKFIGDLYAVRLFGLVADRLGLEHVEGGRRGEAEDARRHLPVRRRAVGDVARPVPRADGRAHPRARARPHPHGSHEVKTSRNLHRDVTGLELHARHARPPIASRHTPHEVAPDGHPMRTSLRTCRTRPALRRSTGVISFDGDCSSAEVRWLSWRRRFGIGAGHAGGRLHAARRHAVDPGRRDASSPTTPTRKSPEATDADGNTFNPSPFNVARSYINVTGNISHIVAFRITPDITRETGRRRARSNGSLVFRLKYAYAQFNLDDWMSRGSWARFGIQQTPCLDFAEGIYRYRFQGTMFVEREGLLRVGRRGRLVPLQLPDELRRRPRRRLQRRELQQGRGQRSEGVR